MAALIFPIPEARAQDASAPAFEVTSIKPSASIEPGRAFLSEYIANGQPTGFLPGDARRIQINGWSTAELVAAAFQVPVRQVVAQPWVFEARYEVEALIASGQTRDRSPEMLRNLLQER